MVLTLSEDGSMLSGQISWGGISSGSGLLVGLKIPLYAYLLFPAVFSAM